MTYEQNIRKVSKRLEATHRNWLMKGVVMGRTRAQAKEAIDLQAEAVKKALQTWGNHGCNINEYLFSQGLILMP
jgi:hypothetical protein